MRPEPCSECGTDLDERSLSKYAETCEIVSEKLNGSQFPVNVFQFCSKLLTQSRLSPFHILFLRCTEPTFENLLEEVREHGDDVSDDLLESALFHGLNLVSGYAKYSSHPGWSHQGLYNLKVAELEFVLGNNQDCRRHLLKAQEILRLAQGNHGSAHLARAQKLLSLLDT